MPCVFQHFSLKWKELTLFTSPFVHMESQRVTALSPCPTQTPRTYCAANTEDLETVIDHIQRAYEAAPIMAAGVSMGG